MKKLVLLLFAALLSFNVNAQHTIKSDEDLQGIWYKQNNKVIVYYHENKSTGDYWGTLTYMDPEEKNDICASVNASIWDQFFPDEGTIEVKKTNCDHPAGTWHTVTFYEIDHNTIRIDGAVYNRKY